MSTSSAWDWSSVKSAWQSSDPAKMAAAIIASADQEPAPLRLLLGSDAYERTHQGLTGRLAALEAQKALAASTDVSDED